TARYSGSGGTSSAARSCRSSSFPNCGAVPWGVTRRGSPRSVTSEGAPAPPPPRGSAPATPPLPGAAATARRPSRGRRAGSKHCPRGQRRRSSEGGFGRSGDEAVLGEQLGERRLPQLLQLVGNAQRRSVEIDHAAEVDRRPDQDDFGVRALDRLSEFLHLLAPVAHRGKKLRDVRPLFECLGDRAYCERPRVDEL